MTSFFVDDAVVSFFGDGTPTNFLSFFAVPGQGISNLYIVKQNGGSATIRTRAGLFNVFGSTRICVTLEDLWFLVLGSTHKIESVLSTQQSLAGNSAPERRLQNDD